MIAYCIGILPTLIPPQTCHPEWTSERSGEGNEGSLSGSMVYQVHPDNHENLRSLFPNKKRLPFEDSLFHQ